MATVSAHRIAPAVLLAALLATHAAAYCCFWSADGNMCGNCGASSSGGDWCGSSDGNCGSCGGTWCGGGGGSGGGGGAPAPEPEPKPAPAPAPLAPAPIDVKKDGFCCWGSTDNNNRCGACNERAPAWDNCSKNDRTCGSCGGYWCSGAPKGDETPKPKDDGGDGGDKPSPPTNSGSLKWTEGTFVTGYWDCCKLSCSWKNKGSVTAPVRSCSARTGNVLSDTEVSSVCNGGDAAACSSQQPWAESASLSYGFTAAAVSGQHGLKGDSNCGECYALEFTDQIHSNGNWGGSHPDLVGHTMVVQVTNIGYDVSGEHSFDLQIPSAGQGAFTSGCTKQFGGSTGDFDCDNNYGGCDNKAGCSRLPAALQKGCEWRFDIFRWLRAAGKSNNPYVKFARVKCPKKLTDISGSIPLDNDNYPSYP